MCGADWIPIVAKECAARAARPTPEFKEKLAADVKAKFAWHQAQIQADFEATSGALVSCTRNQTQILMVTTETASAVAAAALGSCRMELSEAAQALEVWSGGHGCVQGSEKCRESEMAITKAMLPALTAQAMQLRAEAIRKTPR